MLNRMLLVNLYPILKKCSFSTIQNEKLTILFSELKKYITLEKGTSIKSITGNNAYGGILGGGRNPLSFNQM